MYSTIMFIMGVGALVGAIPALAGAINDKLSYGLIGFVACMLGHLVLGFILSVPICAVFMYYILKKEVLPEAKVPQSKATETKKQEDQ